MFDRRNHTNTDWALHFLAEQCELLRCVKKASWHDRYVFPSSNIISLDQPIIWIAHRSAHVRPVETAIVNSNSDAIWNIPHFRQQYRESRTVLSQYNIRSFGLEMR